MNCEQFRELVQDVARDEGLRLSILNEALEHADGCNECDALLDEAESLTANLHALAGRSANEEAPARVEAALLRSFREARAPFADSRRILLWAITGIVGVAAAALLMIVLIQQGRHASVVPGQADKGTVYSTQPGHEAAVSEEADPSLAAGLPADLTEGWPVSFDDDAAGGSFVPLTEAFDPTALDLNAVVRVSMSRVALENLGLYLDAESSEPVVADLVVSSDGMPQAIRVVAW